MSVAERVILFDGVCGFCHGTVQFILARDPGGLFHFSALQSKNAQVLLESHPEVPRDLDTIVLFESGQVYLRSDAVLRILSRLPGAWKWAGLLLEIPRPIRDLLYRAFAQRRYRWFGKLDSCPLPSAETRARFLD